MTEKADHGYHGLKFVALDYDKGETMNSSSNDWMLSSGVTKKGMQNHISLSTRLKLRVYSITSNMI